MIKRPAFCAAWVLCAATGLVLFRATYALAQWEDDEDTQTTLKSAVQQELDALYSRDGRTAPNMTPSSRSLPRSSSSNQQEIQRTASRTSAPSSAKGESDIQKHLRELYERDGREMPEMNFPQARQTEEYLDKDGRYAGEELREFEERREAEREARGNLLTEEKEAQKPSLLQRFNPFKGRARAKEAAERLRAREEANDVRSAYGENTRRPSRSAREVDTEAADPRMTESKSRLRFLPRFLRPREPEVPQESTRRSSEESIANRSRRTMHKEEPTLHDERPVQNLDRRPLPRREEFEESLVQDAPKSQPQRTVSKAAPKIAEKAQRQDAEEWLPPWEEKSEPVAKKPARDEQQRSITRDTERLESPFNEDFNFAESEAESKREAKEERRTAEREPWITPSGNAPREENIASTTSNRAVHSAPRRSDVEKTAQLPYQDDFPDPFTEVTESEADKRRGVIATEVPELNVDEKTDVKLAEQPKTELKETIEDNPFTGLKLDEEKVAAAPKFRSSESAEKVAEVKKPTPRIKQVRAMPKPAFPPAATETKVADAGAPNPFEPEKADELSNAEDPLLRAKMRRLGNRRGLAGLKGFCPVALRDRRDLVDTDPEITATYEGRLYQFSSAEAKATFEAEPEKYAPALGGVDVIVQTNSHQTIDGTLDHAVWFHDKLYLFSSSETLEAFVLNPSEYAGGK